MPWALPHAVLPSSHVDLAVDDQVALPMLLACVPAADVHLAVSPLVAALTVELVVLEFAAVVIALSPRQRAEAVHFVVAPRPDVLAPSFDPLVGAFTLDDACVEGALIHGVVCDPQLALSMLAIKLVVALVLGAVRPLLKPITVSHAIFPFTIVNVADFLRPIIEVLPYIHGRD